MRYPVLYLSTSYLINRNMGCIEITGRSIVDYLNEYRIRKSVWFLRGSSRDIGEIAGLAGFNNISYFNKKFRQYMHTTPGAYKKMMTRDSLLAE